MSELAKDEWVALVSSNILSSSSSLIISSMSSSSKWLLCLERKKYIWRGMRPQSRRSSNHTLTQQGYQKDEGDFHHFCFRLWAIFTTILEEILWRP
mmetsp:Transcript_48235/g.138760  ORF Transcript_48235/g.138760 Transcript_48235/m.138760 type:complete len:96 (-) Transcript_48235:1790-2077(-)